MKTDTPIRLAILALSVTTAFASPAAIAQSIDSARILVSANGTVKTPPDMVTIGYTVRGEGTTSDDAVTALRDSAKAITSGSAAMVGPGGRTFASDFTVSQVRPKECDANRYGTQRLSTGPCAIIGYIAVMPVTVELADVAKSATLTGLISRLGGVDVSIRRFWLRDDASARKSAMQAALTSAREQALAIAQGSGAKLGPVMRVQDANYREVTIDMAGTSGPPPMNIAPPAPPPPPPPPPINVDLKPAPIQTSVRIMVAYALAQ